MLVVVLQLQHWDCWGCKPSLGQHSGGQLYRVGGDGGFPQGWLKAKPHWRGCGSEEVGTLNLVGMSDQVILAVFRGSPVQDRLCQAELDSEVWALFVDEYHQSEVKVDYSVVMGMVIYGTD